MAHIYHCTLCGKTLHPGDALIDMQRLLTQDLGELKLLKFRMRTNDLTELAEQGVWRPSFGELMTIIAENYNLDCPMARALTPEDIDLFLESLRQDDESKDWDDDESDDWGGFGRPGLFLPTQPMTVSDDVISAISLPLEAIYDKICPFHSSEYQTIHELAEDLEFLKKLFAEGDPEFILRTRTMADDADGEIVTGVTVEYRGRTWLLCDCICPRCGEPLPEEAFSIRQHVVTFFGLPATGKTSTILALAHYAKNRMCCAMDDPIWRDTPTIPHIRYASVRNLSSEMNLALHNYALGLAPCQTDAFRRSVPALTLCIVGKDDRKSLLTLTELPGALCGWNGKLDAEKIINDFPIALQSDVLVHCCAPGRLPQKSILGELTNDFSTAQELVRLIPSCSPGTRPMLTLFTDLPVDEPFTIPPAVRSPQPMLHIEAAACAVHELPREILRMHRSFDIPGYHAAMWCHPFGFQVPSRYDVEGLEIQPVLPQPRNIHRLMQWLLCVTGSIPAESVDPITAETYTGHIPRPQDRSQNPIDREEAIARCILFENPGQHDQAFIGVASPFRKIALQMRMRREPNDT